MNFHYQDVLYHMIQTKNSSGPLVQTRTGETQNFTSSPATVSSQQETGRSGFKVTLPSAKPPTDRLKYLLGLLYAILNSFIKI